jgi:hypothetical protein
MLMPKYVMILHVYSAINFDPHSDIMVVHRKSSTSGQPKPVIEPVTAPRIAAHVAIVATSSLVGGTDWTVLSIADAWDSSRRVTEFLEGLKIGRSVRKASPLILLMLPSIDTFY